MQKVKSIFFDLDDTLVNSSKAECDASIEFKKQFSEFNNVNNNYFSNLWHKIAIEQYDRYSKGEITYERHKIYRIISFFQSFNIAIKEEEASNLYKTYLEIYEKKWKTYDDAIDVLKELKSKYKLGIITNGDEHQQIKKIGITGLKEYFNSINISSEIGASKPDRKIFETACERMMEAPKNCVMIGDNYKLDIQGAKNYGLNAIWINRKNEDIEFDNQIKELKELLNIL